MKMKKSLLALVAGLLISSQAAASADFEYDFAPSFWTYSETTDSAYGPSGSLTSSQMQLTSANYSNWANVLLAAPVQNQKGSYAITIPSNVDKISFTYQYSTGDITSSFYDMPQYTLAGVSTDLVPIINQTNYNGSNPPLYGYGAVVSSTGTKTIDVSGKQGKTFSIDQLCNDCILGSATITITNFNVSRIRNNSNVVLSDNKPTISSDAKSYTCKPGTYSFLQYGITKISAAPTSLVYTLIVDGARVSSASSDNWSVLSKSAFDTSNKTVSGVATAGSATWLVDGANTKSAQCEVLAFQDGATALAYSNNS